MPDFFTDLHFPKRTLHSILNSSEHGGPDSVKSLAQDLKRKWQNYSTSQDLLSNANFFPKYDPLLIRTADD